MSASTRLLIPYSTRRNGSFLLRCASPGSNGTQNFSPLERAAVYAGLGDLDGFFEWVERAYEERASDVPLLRNLAWVEDVERDPRFTELLRRIGLEE